MTLTLELSAEEEARLQAQARRQGQNMQDRAHDLVRAGLASESAEPDTVRTAFLQRLLAEGIIPAIPEGRTGPPPHSVPVQGRPVSETLVEERR